MGSYVVLMIGGMKMKMVVMLLVVVVVIWATGNVRAGDYDVFEFPVYTGSGDQALPEIDGNIVVWIDAALNQEGPVHYKNISTDQDYVIDTSKTAFWFGWNPAIDGDTIVWTDSRNEVGGDSDFYGYNILTQTEFVVWEDGLQRPGIDIKGDLVFGVEKGAPGDDYDIYEYNLTTKTRIPISTAPGYQYNPVTNGNVVAWGDLRYNDDNWDIYGYDLTTNAEFAICTAVDSQEQPAISGDIVVWIDARNGNADIYGFDLRTQTEFPICTAARTQGPVAISDNIVVWADNRDGVDINGDYYFEGNWDIYGYDLTTHTEFPICIADGLQISPSISGNTVVWMDDRNGDWDIYGATIPEPCTLCLLGLGGLALLRKGKSLKY
jgi:beta propeller repeat protein